MCCALAILVLTTGGLLRAGDADFAEALADKRWDEAEANARQRLAAEGSDVAAATDLAQVIIESNRREEFPEAVELLERVIEREPDVARHYFYLGQAYGRLAQDAGLRGLSLAGKSRAALARAVELEPENFQYVYALNEFYLDAPGIAGGSVARAREAATAFERVNRDAAALLHAQVLIRERKYAEAVQAIASVTARDDALVNLTRRNLLTRTGLALLAERKAAEALRIFETVTTDFPNNAAGHLGLGRARFETGDLPGAEAALRRSIEIDDGAEAWYRLGVLYQSAGDNRQAREALEVSLARRDSGRNAEDARRRLAALGE